MQRTIFFALALALLATNLFAHSEDSLRFGRFGKVMFYRQSPRPSLVVLFVSGDGGWNLGVVNMARELASLDALVAGIDIFHYLNALEKSNDKCPYIDHVCNPAAAEKYVKQVRLGEIKMLHFCGDEKKDSLCQKFNSILAKIVERKDGHRLGGNYASVAEEILSEVR